MSGVRLIEVTKRFGTVEVIRGVDIEIDEGEFCVFVGPSGCGKSTLLRLIAGLEEISSGTIEIGGRRVNEIDPSRRGTAMVFQTYALYPHMNVERNMGFGLLMNGMPKAEVKARVDKAARILQIGELLERKPRQLSGGQRQRVAIGRAIVRDPEVFLFDEPLSNLDAELRVATRLEIAKLHHQLDGSTMVYVTHDQVEAMTLADKIVVLRDGRVEQIGAPMDLYERPRNRFVAGFIGSPKMNFLTLKPVGAGAAELPDGTADRADRRGRRSGRAGRARRCAEGGRYRRGGRTARYWLSNALAMPTTSISSAPWEQELVARFDPGARVRVGDRIGFAFSGRTHLFDADGLTLRGASVASGPHGRPDAPPDPE